MFESDGENPTWEQTALDFCLTFEASDHQVGIPNLHHPKHARFDLRRPGAIDVRLSVHLRLYVRLVEQTHESNQ